VSNIVLFTRNRSGLFGPTLVGFGGVQNNLNAALPAIPGAAADASPKTDLITLRRNAFNIELSYLEKVIF